MTPRTLELVNLLEGRLRVALANHPYTATDIRQALGYVEELDRLLRYNTGRSVEWQAPIVERLTVNNRAVYEAAQRYRHAPLAPQAEVLDAFHDLVRTIVEESSTPLGRSEGSTGQTPDDEARRWEGQPVPAGESEERQLIRELAEAERQFPALVDRAQAYLASAPDPTFILTNAGRVEHFCTEAHQIIRALADYLVRHRDETCQCPVCRAHRWVAAHPVEGA